MTYLARILEEKQREVLELKKGRPLQRYEELRGSLGPVRDFRAAVSGGGASMRLIAEVKKASPSRGVIVRDFDPVKIAGSYMELGASAFSVLTDRMFFQGSDDYLSMVREAYPLPVLRKDFIVDESQIFHSRLIGADAILLIVAALQSIQLSDYLQAAAALGLHALVEVHDRRELDTAVDCGAGIIGVNNRDLRDFTLRLETSLALRPFIPSGVVAVSESGMKTRADIALLKDASFDAVLIGEGLHTSPELREITW
ncbi:MAG: indole-3-glycerol phosphate synthase TrpC [Chlorobiaceae bacterium]|nr:indole-3-glycerol phosphate synthase TrpC [Chlorobiaceae bacterium]